MFCYLPGVVRFGFHSQEKRRAGVLGVEEVKKFGDLEVHRIKKNAVDYSRIRDQLLSL